MIKPLTAAVAIAALCASHSARGQQKAAPRGRLALAPEEIASRAEKAVVVVECRVHGATARLGSGFVFDSSGLVATNAHVILGCESLIARTEEKDSHRKALPISVDVDRDVAILYSPGITKATLSLSKATKLRPGQKVFAVGHPEGMEYTVSDGIVSAIRESGTVRYIQTTAPISPGSSGGPLLDGTGQVVGMTTLYLSVGQNLNFAVPADYIAEDGVESARWLREHPALASALDRASLVPPIMSAKDAAKLARSSRKAGSFDDARSILETALQRSPDDTDLLVQLVELDCAQSAFVDAMTTTRHLLTIAPNSAAGHECLAGLFYRKQMIGEARAEAEQGLSLHPDPEYSSVAHVVLSGCAASTKDFVDAVEHMSAAMEYEETRNDPNIRATYAELLLGARRVDEADTEAIAAISLDPQNADLKARLWKSGLPRGARIVSQSDELDALHRYFVKGIVTNEGRRRLRSVRVVAELRWAVSDRLVGTGQGYVEPDSLAPGDSGTFQVEVKGFSLPSQDSEPYPDLERILGRRPTVSTAQGSGNGGLLDRYMEYKRQSDIDAQNEWDAKARRLVQQWKARREAPPDLSQYRYRAYVAAN